MAAGVVSGSVALLSFAVDSGIERGAWPPIGVTAVAALAMVPIIAKEGLAGCVRR